MPALVLSNWSPASTLLLKRTYFLQSNGGILFKVFVSSVAAVPVIVGLLITLCSLTPLTSRWLFGLSRIRGALSPMSSSTNKSFFCIVHAFLPFTRKQIVSLYFGQDVRTRLGVAIFEVSDHLSFT